MAERSWHGYQGMSPEIGLEVSPAGKSSLYLYQQFTFSRLRDSHILNFDCPGTFQNGGEHASEFQPGAKNLADYCSKKEYRYIPVIKM